MRALSHDDLDALVSSIHHRAHLLNMIADGMVAAGSQAAGNALAQLSADMRTDLSTLQEGLESLAVPA